MIDEIITKANSKDGYDKEAYKQRKKEQKEKAYQIIDDALEELKNNPSALKEYFDMQSRFDMYTPRNALLIKKQCPTATQLKTRKDWMELKVAFKNKAQQIITILEPGDSYEVNGRTFTPYNAKDMIDVSETNTKPFTRTFDKRYVLQAMLHDCPIDVKVVDSLNNGMLCECNVDDKVLYVSRNDVNEEYIKSVATEIAKMNLFETTDELDTDKADCIGYMVCKKYGIDAPIESLDRMCAKYSNMEKQDIANDLTSMKEIAQDINSRMGQYLDDKRKELKNKEQAR